MFEKMSYLVGSLQAMVDAPHNDSIMETKNKFKPGLILAIQVAQSIIDEHDSNTHSKQTKKSNQTSNFGPSNLGSGYKQTEILMKTKMLWVGTSKNPKTGNIPQGYVGQTIDKAKASCAGCPLKETACYHWKGSSQLGHGKMTTTYKTQPERYTLENALNNSVRSAKYARGAVGGDPSAIDRETVQSYHDEIKQFGLKGLILYTHFADSKGEHLKGLSMASCDLSEADKHTNNGWRVAAVLPMKMGGVKKFKDVPEYDGREFETPEGKKVVVCPAQTKRGVDCNNCGLCDATRDVAPVIGFLMH